MQELVRRHTDRAHDTRSDVNACHRARGARYSKAMTASGMKWDEQTLDVFLTEPTRDLPGTTMSARMPNPQDRADVIAYLKTLVSP
jgi:cytochrome c2